MIRIRAYRSSGPSLKLYNMQLGRDPASVAFHGFDRRSTVLWPVPGCAMVSSCDDSRGGALRARERENEAAWPALAARLDALMARAGHRSCRAQHGPGTGQHLRCKPARARAAFREALSTPGGLIAGAVARSLGLWPSSLALMRPRCYRDLVRLRRRESEERKEGLCRAMREELRRPVALRSTAGVLARHLGVRLPVLRHALPELYDRLVVRGRTSV